jgi:hypothetical protein
MQVGSGSATALPHLSNNLTAIDLLTLDDPDLTQVKKHRDQTVAMIDEDAFSWEEEVARQGYPALRYRDDFRARVGCVVGTRMRAARLVVEVAAVAKSPTGG